MNIMKIMQIIQNIQNNWKEIAAVLGFLTAFLQFHKNRKQSAYLYNFLHGLKGAELTPRAEKQVNDMMQVLKPPKKRYQFWRN